MTGIMNAIKRVAVKIDNVIKKGEVEKAHSLNSSGDEQVKLDLLSDKIIEDEFKQISIIKEIASEEKEGALKINENGDYLIAYDPLDGSSLVDVNLSVGSIFGIYKDEFSGPNIVASAYVVYGPRLELVIARDNVELYRFDYEKGEFVYQREIRLKEKGKIMAPGGTQKGWYPYHKEMIDNFFKEGYRLRYSGGMVPDLHQILLKGGGLFSYPATTDREKGKLRKLFEVFPFAYVFNQAGGLAIDGEKDLLNLGIENLHDTTPCFFGSNYEVTQVLKTYSKATQ